MYKCNQCKFESDSEKGLKIHTSQVHKSSQKKTYNCEGCGDTFEDYPSWIGGHANHYGENWNEERHRALDVAGYECKLCGMTRNEHYNEYGFDLDVHHRIPLRAFDVVENANFQSNLVVCCRNCHQSKLEADPIPHNDIRAPV